MGRRSAATPADDTGAFAGRNGIVSRQRAGVGVDGPDLSALPVVAESQKCRVVSNVAADGGLLQPLMVTRLDGLTPAAVTHMIDTGIAVEKKGLEGKIYLDARGMHGTDGYAVFDADIRAAADWLRLNSSMDVLLDDTPEFFEAKNCPDAALYCGWYSLHAYRDSCQWLPGAVGYHVASFEMESLHDVKETGWVTNLLKRGFCGTLGSTAEPYLTAFPKPSKFFPLCCRANLRKAKCGK